MKKQYLPISIDITNEKILVLGGDSSALNKIKILQRFGANIEVISKHVIAEIKHLKIKTTIKEYEPSDLEGYLMVYSCLNNAKLDQQIVSDAKARGDTGNIETNYCRLCPKQKQRGAFWRFCDQTKIYNSHIERKRL